MFNQHDLFYPPRRPMPPTFLGPEVYPLPRTEGRDDGSWAGPNFRGGTDLDPYAPSTDSPVYGPWDGPRFRGGTDLDPYAPTPARLPVPPILSRPDILKKHLVRSLVGPNFQGVARPVTQTGSVGERLASMLSAARTMNDSLLNARRYSAPTQVPRFDRDSAANYNRSIARRRVFRNGRK
jgi:hypothetical protein